MSSRSWVWSFTTIVRAALPVVQISPLGDAGPTGVAIEGQSVLHDGLLGGLAVSHPRPRAWGLPPCCNVSLEQDATLITVVEMGHGSWLVAGIVPGLDRYPLKKLGPDCDALLRLLHRWRNEAAKAGHAINRIAVAYEAGRDGFWLARWLRAQAVEAYVIHPSSVPVPREHRRAKTDRPDTETPVRPAYRARALRSRISREKTSCTSMSAVSTPTTRPSTTRDLLKSFCFDIGALHRLVAATKAPAPAARPIESKPLAR
jgi:hypothetical protein